MYRPTSVPCILICLFFLCFFSGCDKSGYGLGSPYVITGMVYTGSAVKGTVHLETYKLFDYYQTEIQPDGSYQISVVKEDPPYLLWAEIEGGGTLFSFTTGDKNPTQAEIDKANADDTAAAPIYYQTVNITPLTDMIIGLAYNQDPQALFLSNPYSGFPTSATVNKKQGSIQDIFKDVFTAFGYKKGYNLLHDDLIQNTNIKNLINLLYVNYTTESPEVFLKTVSKSQTLYEYSFNDQAPVKANCPDSADVASIISNLLYNQ